MGKRKGGRRDRHSTAGGIAIIVLIAVLVVGLSALSPGTGDGAFNAEVTATSPIRISEIVAANTSSLMLTDGTLPDWIELENTGEEDISLAGYALMCNDNPTDVYRIQSAVIPAGGYILIYADGGSDRGSELHAPFRLSASGETVVLMNAAGAVIDSVHTPEMIDDQAYSRDASGEWTVSLAPSPGGKNGVETASERLQNAMSGAVAVTEVMSANASYCPDENGECHDYVELTNTSDEEVSLKGWYLSDDRSNLAQWKFPDVTLAAGGTMVVYCSGYDRTEDVGRLHANFRLGSDGADVVLTQSDGQTAALVAVPALETDQAYSLMEGEWTKEFAPTPGMENSWENAVRASESIREKNSENVLISELCASTTQMNGTDWIELYNAGSEAVDLSGYGLTDNAARPRKWQFPTGTVIQPGEYLGVLCSGLDGVSGGQYHTNFKLSAEGGYTVALSRPDGTIIDRTFVPRQYEDVTYGRVEGSDGFYYFTLQTPLAKNDGTPYLGRASQPKYSVEGGLYTTGDVLTVEMTSAPGTRIYYTLDNTDPTEASTPYTGPITIAGTTILRTRVYGDNYLESFMDSQSYLYDVDNGSGVYVVSLVSDPYNLTSQEAGIMIRGENASADYPYPGANFWQDWEREAHVEVFSGDGETVLSQGCGIKLHGQYSRAEKQQAFKVIARTRYGGNRFQAALFSNRDYQEYQSFLLRSSGQDTDKTRMRDSVLTTLARDTSVMYQETEICVLYLDGQYWGQYNLRERINADSICQFEGWEGDEDTIDIVKANTNTMQGSNKTFADLIAWVKQADPTTDQFYEHLDQVIDIRNYIEYMAIEIYVGNGDTLNVKRYRNANADGKWRWVLFDLDWAFYVDTNSIRRWLEPGGMGTNLYTDNSLFIACMKNPRFRDEFLTYMGEQMATTFTAENLLNLFQERYTILEPLMPAQLTRWGQTMEQYQKEMKMLIDYAKERPLKMLQYFSGYGIENNNIYLSEEEMKHYFGEALEIVQGGT